MIISASYRTDIPAFYGDWFINRLNAGYCMVANPYGGKPYRVSLRREHVDGFVFWTKNLGPFLPKLQEIKERGFPFLVQYTINGYPRTLEFSVVDAERSIKHMHEIKATYGSRVAVWRYDTIVFTSVTPPSFHLENFARLAEKLEGTTDEAVVSFAQIYKKTLRNMNTAAKNFDFTWNDPSDSEKRELLLRLTAIAKNRGIQLTVCSQKDLVVAGAQEAHCIDAGRLSEIAQKDVRAKMKGNRPDCACFISRDIGTYDTCPHGCVYCYAVMNRDLAQRRYKEHDPQNEYLYPQLSLIQNSEDVSEETNLQQQLPLF